VKAISKSLVEIIPSSIFVGKERKKILTSNKKAESTVVNDGFIKIDTYLILYIMAWVVTLFHIFQIAVNE
jgi:hypothetical protein